MHVIIVRDGVVDNVICADSLERVQGIYPDCVCIVRSDDDLTGCGWIMQSDNSFVAPPAGRMTPISKLAFLSRFTQQQQISIRALRSTDPIIDNAFYMLDQADEVALDHSDTIMYVEYLVSESLISADDAQRILS